VLFELYLVYELSLVSCTVLFVSISQVISCEDRLRVRNDLDCVGWGVKLYSNSNCMTQISALDKKYLKAGRFSLYCN